MTLTISFRRPAGVSQRPQVRTVGPLLAAAVLALSGAGAVRAADPPARPAAAKPAARPAAKPAPVPRSAPKPREPLLTREQLAACMSQQERVRTANAEASQAQADLEREKAELLKEGEELKTLLASIDRSDPAAVEAYNQRATARDQRIDAFEPRVKAFNEKVESISAERAAFARDCQDKRFDEKDEKAITGK